MLPPGSTVVRRQPRTPAGRRHPLRRDPSDRPGVRCARGVGEDAPHVSRCLAPSPPRDRPAGRLRRRSSSIEEPELGLDLRGGAQFIFEAQEHRGHPGHGRERRPDPRGAARSRRRARRRRVDRWSARVTNRILVELPGITDEEEADEAREQIGQTAQLTVHPVLARGAGRADQARASPTTWSSRPTRATSSRWGRRRCRVTRSPAPRPRCRRVGVGRQRRLQRRGLGRLRRALGRGGLRPGCPEPDRDRARRRVISSPGVSVPCGGHDPQHDRDLRRLHQQRGPGARGPDRGRRAAAAAGARSPTGWSAPRSVSRRSTTPSRRASSA